MDRMLREYGVRANVGKPQVAYKETIVGRAEGTGQYIRQMGGRGQYGHCRVSVEPLKRGAGFEFGEKIRAGLIPKEFVPSIRDGVREAMEGGMLAGFPLTDVRVTLVDGSSHDDDSTPLAFKIAGSLAFKEAARQAGLALLEPIMRLEDVTPEEYLGDVVSDLTARRGKIDGMEMRGGTRAVRALVPLAETFGYATILRTLTQGRASFSLEFYSYEVSPPQKAEEVVARIEGRAPVPRA